MKSTFNKINLVLLLITTIALVSCKDDNNQDYAVSNQEFVTRASGGNNFEVAAGGLAMSKAEKAEVKHYGEHMVTDHTAAGLELKSLASQKNWSISEGLLLKDQAMLAKLAGLSGNAFDREFMRIMVQSHQETVALFETGSSPMGLADADLRAMASSKLPTLKAHLQEAIVLNAGLNP
ncbi:DUF4142 domain-containing protein [Pedobacter steynii]|uniref:DUF4142 domain-containing protein n=1 Tax=Pedobacter steynii TaxID=430522 RepID=A0A1D7QJP5_9SPHI|nr:DUF4142 domain-containing protein [Pedobacter steynii]AOM78881.1 hypothetical protein BFS30_17910 [Pedobacter steynii]